MAVERYSGMVFVYKEGSRSGSNLSGSGAQDVERKQRDAQGGVARSAWRAECRAGAGVLRT